MQTLEHLRVPLKTNGERGDWMLVAARYLNTVPLVREGQEVWCRCASGYVVRRIARSDALGQLVWNVPVSDLDAWRRDREHAGIVMWPAASVVPGDLPAPGPILGAL